MARRWTLYLPVMIAATVAVACLVALLAISQKAEAAFPGKNGRIAYQGSDQSSYYVIYTIDPNGDGRPRSRRAQTLPSRLMARRSLL
jgi:hypothetical protein